MFRVLFRLSLSCLLLWALLLVPSLAVQPARAQEIILKKGDGLTKDVALKDAAKYTQVAMDISGDLWGAFAKLGPDAADDIKDMLTFLTAWQETKGIDQDPLAFWRAFKTVGEFALGKGIDWWDDVMGTPVGPITSLFSLYNDSLQIIHDRLFIPYLVDSVYEKYRSLRQGGGSHQAAWAEMANIPEPVIANTILEVTLKQHGVVPGVYEGIKFDKNTLAQLDKSVSGSAAGRTIVITHKPKLTLSGGQHFLLNKDISQRIEVLAPRVDDWQSWLLDLRNAVTKRDLEQRQTPGYPALSSADENALEAEFKRLLAALKAVDLGPQIRQEALAHIGKTLQLRYEQEAAKAAMEQAAEQAKARLRKDMQALAAYAWPKLIQVSTVNQAGETVPVEGAALFVDGRLCTRETNGGKPCGTNRYGLAGLHLLLGGHDVLVRAPGYEDQEIYITAHIPDEAKPGPEEFDVVLVPSAPLDLFVRLVSDADNAPVAGAALSLAVEGDAPLTATTDGQGGAVLRQIPAGASLDLSVQAPGYEPARFTDLAPGSASADDPLELVLNPYYTDVAVLVVGPDGAPLVGATVSVGEHTQATGPDGKALFRLPPSPADGYAVAATSGDLPRAEDVLVLAPQGPGQNASLTLALKVAGSILVVVRDSGNHMVAGAQAVLSGPGSDVVLPADASGMVHFDDLAPGAYYLTARAPGHQSPEEVEVLISPAQAMHKVRLTLTAGMELKVLLVDQNRNTVSGRVALDGKWANAPTGSATFSGVTPGAHALTAEGPDGSKATGSYNADPTAKGRDSLTLTLAKQPEPQPGGGPEWTYSSYGETDGLRTYRYVRVNGKPVLAGEAEARTFCASQGLEALLPQPAANITNWQENLFNANGWVGCLHEQPGGQTNICRGYKDITCILPPPEPPCDPNDPLCGLDTDL